MPHNLDQQLPHLLQELCSQDNVQPLNTRWESLLTQIFPDADLSCHNQSIDQCQLSDDHSRLKIPAIYNGHMYELQAATSTTGFSTTDIRLIESLLTMTRQFISTQEAIKQGALEERQRIARDLHDDVAARLLTLIHSSDNEQTIRLTRSILKSLRNAIYTLDNKATTTILDAITDMRSEIQERLNTLGILLDWQPLNAFDGLSFTPRQHINLHRILHEITTNIIRHADANIVSISLGLDHNRFHLRSCDNGQGFDIQHCIPGKGINNIQVRVAELNGQVSWQNNTNTEFETGCCVDIHFPLTTGNN